jgi:hypothetical protein
MELTLAVDGLMPATVRFGCDDFVDIAQATAVEVAAVIRRTLPEVNATSVNSRVRLVSDTVDNQSALQVIPTPTTVLSIESAPAGRLSPLSDSLGRIRLFYEAWEKPTQREAGASSSGGQTPANTGGYVLRRVHYKTFVDGAWRDSHPMFSPRLTPQGDPAALALPDDRIWVAWVDEPQTANSRLCFAFGTSRPPLPARLLGQCGEPSALSDGKVLTLTGDWSGVDRYIVHAADFANPAQATAAEVVAAMNRQFTHVVAIRERNGSIRLETVSLGVQAYVTVDLRRSTTVRALGFDNSNAAGIPGSWSEEIECRYHQTDQPAADHRDIETRHAGVARRQPYKRRTARIRTGRAA